MPFLSYEQHTVSGFASIVKHIEEGRVAERVGANAEAMLDRVERSKIVAWSAHIESQLGNILVRPRFHGSWLRLLTAAQYYALYSHLDNWVELTHPALVSLFPVPQQYYVPGRIRESYRPRLEAAGLWNLQPSEKDEKKPFKEAVKVNEKEENKRKFQEAFGREKVHFEPSYVH